MLQQSLEMRPVVLILFGLCCGVNGLKCRSQEGPTDAELKRIVRSCMQRSSSSTGGNNQDQDNERYYGNPRYNFDSSYNGRDYGQERGQGQGQGQRQQQNYDNRWRRSSKQSDSSNSNNKANNTSEMGACVAQCFFEEMNMVSRHRHVAHQVAAAIISLLAGGCQRPAGTAQGHLFAHKRYTRSRAAQLLHGHGAAMLSLSGALALQQQQVQPVAGVDQVHVGVREGAVRRLGRIRKSAF